MEKNIWQTVVTEIEIHHHSTNKKIQNANIYKEGTISTKNYALLQVEDLIEEDLSVSEIQNLPVIISDIDCNDKSTAFNKTAPVTVMILDMDTVDRADSPSILEHDSVKNNSEVQNIPEEKDISAATKTADTVESIDKTTTFLNTSTPLCSPATSVILRNLGIDKISFSNIATPSSTPLSASSPNSDTTFCSMATIDDIEDTTSTDTARNDNNATSKRKRKTKKKTDLGKKRKVHKSEWIDNKRKACRNKGLAYVSRNGKERPGKSLLPPCDNYCRLKCSDKISEDIRKGMFKEFWSLGDRGRQWELLLTWCEKITKRRITTEAPSKRQFTVRYYLPDSLENCQERRKVNVCRKMFLNTFCIGQSVVRTALKKVSDNNGIAIGGDMRGHHDNHKKIINSDMIQSVSEHVRSFTPVESHYTRKDSTKLYLESDLTMNKMFKLYCEWVTDTNINKAKTLRQYTDIVNEHFNLEFHKPKKDQCDECVSFKNLPKPVSQEEQLKYDTHIKNKDLVRSLKNEDKLAAINSPNTIVTAAFDFEKVLSAPHAEVSLLYYKRKLSVFNFTVFDMGKKVGRCYMWDESVAKRGANEVASCLYDFIKEHAGQGINNFYLYSDNCGGQNRNRIVFLMYMIAAKQFNVNITHRFLEKGHTQNENDSIHALIERCSKNKVIYTPDQWIALVRWAKETGEPYIVKEMSTNNFLNFKSLLAGRNWVKNNRNQKVQWSKIREVNTDPSNSDILNYKNDFCETMYQTICIKKNTRRQLLYVNEELTQAYNGPLAIPKSKLIDLKYLCDHNIIPVKYHGFYNTLKCDNDDHSDSESD